MRLKLALAMALIVVAGINQQTHADVLLTGTNASFNYDTDGAGDGFSFIADPMRGNALGNIEAWLRYDKGDGSGPIIAAFSGASEVLGSPGQVAFDDITVLGDGVFNPRTITPILNFSLVEVNSDTARLDYSLELSGSNFSGAEPVVVDAFVSFDFLGTGADEVDNASPAFGDLVILDSNDDGSGPGLAGINTISGGDVVTSAFDVFNRGFGFPSADRFNATNDLTTSGSNLALGHYFSFGSVPASAANPDFVVTGNASLGAAVPEPSTTALLLFGFAGMVWRRNRS